MPTKWESTRPIGVSSQVQTQTGSKKVALNKNFTLYRQTRYPIV